VFLLNVSSEMKLHGVHAHLVQVVHDLERNTTMPFAIVDGLRTLEQQKALVAKGASRTMQSRHLTGHAVDMVPLKDGKPSWDWALINQFFPQVKAAAERCNVQIECGAEWKEFPDGAHYQLPRSVYP
jgi:peptidoglycan L-alanyl-D-glutamate endopeptidase CwlK